MPSQDESKTPQRRSMTPLWIISLFVGLTETTLGISASQTTGGIQVALTAFVIAFPFIVALAFFIILWSRPYVLYPPTDYGQTDIQQFVSAMTQTRSTNIIKKPADSVGSIEPDKESNETSAAAKESAKAELNKSSPPEESEPQLMEKAVTKGELLKKLEDAIREGEREEAKTVLEKLETVFQNVVRFKCYYYYLWYKRGDSSAIAELEKLTEKEESAQLAYFFIGRAYEDFGEYSKAMKAYDSAAINSTEPTEKANCIVKKASCLFEDGKTDEAFSVIMREISSSRQEEAKEFLYIGLADLYEKSGDYELRALALEKAIEICPNNSDTTFKVAYSYSKKNFTSLSLLHYNKLLSVDIRNPAALNNIGVAYDELKMPLLSVSFYRKAEEENNTLAMANLAYRLLNSGFKQEASDILDKAKRQEDAHPNVARAIAALSEKEEQESEAEKSILTSAAEQQKFFRSFAEAYFAETVKPAVFNGAWKFPDGIEVKITADDTGFLQAAWEQVSPLSSILVSSFGGAERKDKFKIEGKLCNGAARIVKYIFKEEYSFDQSKTIGSYSEVAKGYMFIYQDKNNISIMAFENNKHSITGLLKIGVRALP